MPAKYAVEERPSVNGVVAMPVKTVVLELDEIGYPGWKCTLRTNPRAELWDKFLTEEGADQVWENLGRFILEWNFGDEEGKALPLPPKTRRQDLPVDVPNYLITKFIDAFNEVTGFPKLPSNNSENTSPTKSTSQD